MEPWRRNQLAVTAAAFVGFIGFTLVMPFLALYFQELGVTDTADVALWTGLTLGVTPAITAFLAPLWGRVGDRFGNKLLVQRSLVGGIAVMLLMGFATRPWHLFALRAVQGLIAGYGPLTLAMAAAAAPPDRMARAIALVQTAQRVGPAIGPVIGGVLASMIGLRRVFLVASAVYLAASVMMAVLYVEPRTASAGGRAPARMPFREILKFQNFMLLMGVIFGLQLVDKSFGPILLLHLEQAGYSADERAVLAGALFSVLAFSGAFGNQLAASLVKRLTARALIEVAVLAAALAMAVFAVADDAWVMLVAIGIFGAAVGTAMTTAFAAAGAVIPRHVHGASFGLLTSASLIGFAVSPIVSGLVGGRSIRMVFVLGVVALGVLAFAVRRLMVQRALEIEPAPTVEES